MTQKTKKIGFGTIAGLLLASLGSSGGAVYKAGAIENQVMTNTLQIQDNRAELRRQMDRMEIKLDRLLERSLR